MGGLGVEHLHTHKDMRCAERTIHSPPPLLLVARSALRISPKRQKPFVHTFSQKQPTQSFEAIVPKKWLIGAKN